MRRVYSEAARVIVWLGKGSDKADGAFKLLASIPAFLEEYSSRIPESDGNPELPALDLEVLNAVGESPWWTRAWCLQEIVMAKEASLYLGSASLDWRGQGNHQFQSLFVNMMERFPNFQIFFRQLTIIEQCRRQEILPEFLIIAKHGNLQTTDPRGQIYSFLGLVCKGDLCHSDATLQPDYTLRLSDVLTRVAIHLLKHHGLDILSFATEGLIRRLGQASHFVYYRPTWVPDWRNTEWVEGSHLAFTNLLWSTDPAMKFAAQLSRAWEEKMASIEAGRRRLYALNREMVHRT